MSPRRRGTLIALAALLVAGGAYLAMRDRDDAATTPAAADPASAETAVRPRSTRDPAPPSRRPVPWDELDSPCA